MPRTLLVPEQFHLAARIDIDIDESLRTSILEVGVAA